MVSVIRGGLLFRSGRSHRPAASRGVFTRSPVAAELMARDRVGDRAPLRSVTMSLMFPLPPGVKPFAPPLAVAVQLSLVTRARQSVLDRDVAHVARAEGC